MNINERIDSKVQNIQDVEKQKILEIQKSKERSIQVFNDLKLEKFLEEIKTNIWEYGEINIKTPDNCNQKLKFPFYINNDSCVIELIARWPKFRPGHMEQKSLGDDPDYYVDPSIEINGSSIFIEVNSSSTKIVMNENNEPFRHGNNPAKYIKNEPNREEYKNKIEEEILKFCVEEKLKGRYPLTLEIQKDRQEIIQKINSGELLIKNVPNGFFSEKEMKLVNPPQTKTEISQKRSFLDKLLGK